MNGPLWLDPINNIDFVKDLVCNFDAVKAQDTNSKSWDALKQLKITKFDDINGVLRGALQEEPVQSIPVTWDFTDLFGAVKVGAPKNTAL